ncbi:MAG: carbon storage regulator [Legionellaceae bacterium]|nr:carbon storage regulator [Legionellaceae bacterium]
MLVLHRKAGQRILIGNDIEIHIVSAKGSNVQLAIKAPPEFRVAREDKVPIETNELKN